MNVFGGKNTQPNETIIDTPKNLVGKINNKVNRKAREGALGYKKIEPKNNVVKSIKKPKKIFGLDARSVVAVVSIALFFMFSMAGVLIALRQRMSPEKVAVPTAPSSKPAAAELIEPPETGSCILAFNITEPSPSPSISPSPSVSPSPTPSPSVSPSPSPVVSPSPTPSPSVSPSPSPVVYDCDSDCETNEQCESAKTDYICSTEYGDKCRLDSNPESEQCETKPNEYACDSSCETNEQCQAASSSYICYQNNCRLDSNPSAQNCQPTTYVYTPPVIGCNDICVNNGDCSNSEHICYNNACRLATNPTSSTCSIAQTTTYQTTTKGGQPVLPVELPESGSNIILDWLKAGLGVLGIGTVLLLLL